MLRTFQGNFSTELHISTWVTKSCQIVLCLGNTNYWRNPEGEDWRFSCLSFLSLYFKLCITGSVACCDNGQVVERHKTPQRRKLKLILHSCSRQFLYYNCCLVDFLGHFFKCSIICKCRNMRFICFIFSD